MNITLTEEQYFSLIGGDKVKREVLVKIILDREQSRDAFKDSYEKQCALNEELWLKLKACDRTNHNDGERIRNLLDRINEACDMIERIRELPFLPELLIKDMDKFYASNK